MPDKDGALQNTWRAKIKSKKLGTKKETSPSYTHTDVQETKKLQKG